MTMLNVQVIGTGAAGNNATITLLETGVIDKAKDILLLNSTKKDIPSKYTDYAIEFGDIRGCGKEREVSRQMILEALRSKQIDLESFIRPETQMVIIVTSLEGGTGCGSALVLAEYVSSVLGKNVHLFAFAGFEDDPKGMANTVDWFKELNDQYTVEVISNKKFLEEANGNRHKAELLANEEFAKRVSILLGNSIVPSETNIDDTDLYKLTTIPGFMTIESTPLAKIKSVDDFNNALTEMVDNSKSLETEQSAYYIGVIFNGSDKTKQYIDESYSILKERYGKPMEFFRHYQNVQDDEYFAVIIGGMKIPNDEVNAIYNRFLKESESTDTTRDKFFDNKAKFDTSKATRSSVLNRRGSSFISSKEVANNQKNFFGKYSMNAKPDSDEEDKPVNNTNSFNHFRNTTKNEI